MIARLRGVVLETGVGNLILDVHGVGYRLLVPDSTMHQVPAPGEEVTLHVHMHVREDALQLYAFASRSELRLFETVVGVGGIGPRLALVILSHLSPEAFVQAVLSNESGPLTKIPGIGKKTAARILLELKDKLQASWSDDVQVSAAAVKDGSYGMLNDAVAALVALGYVEQEAEDAVKHISSSEEEDHRSVQTLVRAALQQLDRAV